MPGRRGRPSRFGRARTLRNKRDVDPQGDIDRQNEQDRIGAPVTSASMPFTVVDSVDDERVVLRVVGALLSDEMSWELLRVCRALSVVAQAPLVVCLVQPLQGAPGVLADTVSALSELADEVGDLDLRLVCDPLDVAEKHRPDGSALRLFAMVDQALSAPEI